MSNKVSVVEKLIMNGETMEDANNRMIKMNILGDEIVVLPSGRVVLSQVVKISGIARQTVSDKINNPNKFDENDKKFLKIEDVSKETVVNELIGNTESLDAQFCASKQSSNSNNFRKVKNSAKGSINSNESIVTQNFVTMGSRVSNESIDAEISASMGSSNSNNFRKVKNPSKGSKHGYYTNGKQSIEINNNGEKLISYIGAVYLMTLFDSPYANEVSAKLIAKTVVSDIQHDSLTKWHETTISSMREAVENNKSLNDMMGDFIDLLLDDTKLMYKDELLDVKKDLVDLLGIIEDRIANKQDNRYQVQVTNRNIVSTSIRDIDNAIQELDNTIIESVNQPGNYLRDNILKQLYPNLSTIKARTKAGELNVILEEAGFIKINRWTVTDKDGKTIKKSKPTINPKNPWVFDSLVGQFGSDKSTSFNLTKYGYALWTYLYTEAKKCNDAGLPASSICIDKKEFDAKYCFDNK